MLIIPAVDIMDGKVVRLYQGDFKKKTIYSSCPQAVALKWQDEGAEFLHLVDLDGALRGEPKNIDLVIEIAQSLEIPVEFSGGLRTLPLIRKVLKTKIQRVIIGTRALEYSFLKKAIKEFKSRICVSIDERKSRVVTSGWKKMRSIRPLELADALREAGVKRIIYTDILRDGTLKGPNFAAIKKILAETKIPLIASGGVSSLEDLRKLKNLKFCGRQLEAVIIGRALYEKRFSLSEAIKIAG